MYEQADPLYLRAIDIWEAALGSDHPQVAIGLSNRAELLQNQVRAVRIFQEYSCGAQQIFQVLNKPGGVVGEVDRLEPSEFLAIPPVPIGTSEFILKAIFC